MKKHILLVLAIVLLVCSFVLAQTEFDDFYFKLLFFGSIGIGAFDFVLTAYRLKKELISCKRQ